MRYHSLDCKVGFERAEQSKGETVNCQKIMWPVALQLCGLASSIFRGLPGALGTLRFRQVAAFHAIVHVTIADGAERFVVQAHSAQRFAQFFGELVYRLQVVGCGGNLGFAGLEEFLMALVDKPGDIAADQVTGLGKDAPRGVLVLFNGGRDAKLLHEDTVLRARRFQNVKAVLAKPLHRFFVGPLLVLGCHVFHLCIDWTPAYSELSPILLRCREALLSHNCDDSGKITVAWKGTPVNPM